VVQDPQPIEDWGFFYGKGFMTERLNLVLGGARSGKSSFSLELAGKKGKEKFYLATAEAHDEEMKKRIEHHREKRAGSWKTIEEPLDITNVLKKLRSRCDVVVIDCMTLWLSNLLHQGYDDETIAIKTKELLDTIKGNDYLVIAVSNEVGMGIVPDNRLARDFRDFAGRLNQEMAGAADEVYFLISSIPQKIKFGEGRNEQSASSEDKSDKGTG
jgi:adenosylcobinamide kinase/adenosylcobinamide-phosphate guanylyltransferase